jgi:hypothetical protein
MGDVLMKWFFRAFLVAAYALGAGTMARADDKAATAVLDKAIKALGGEEKLAKVYAMTWKGKGKITFGDNTSEFGGQTTVRGLNHYRSEFDGEFNGNAVHGVTVLAGDKGWRKFGDNASDIDGDALDTEKRRVYLQVLPTVLVPLKGKEYKIETAGEEKVDGKPAAGLKVTGPDGKDFTLYFDTESGLPVKLVARVMGFNGEEFTQETTITDYKDFDGIKKSMKSNSSRDGQRFVEYEITEFKVLDKVDDATFAEPK